MAALNGRGLAPDLKNALARAVMRRMEAHPVREVRRNPLRPQAGENRTAGYFFACCGLRELLYACVPGRAAKRERSCADPGSRPANVCEDAIPDSRIVSLTLDAASGNAGGAFRACGLVHYDASAGRV